MNKPPIKKKSWHKPTKPNFTSLNNVILNCFVSLPHFQWTRLYCKGQKRHSRQWAGSCYGDVLTQTRRVRPLKLLPRCFIMALHLQRTQQRQGSWINSNILVLLHSPECACDSSESHSLSLPSFFSFFAACPRSLHLATLSSILFLATCLLGQQTHSPFLMVREEKWQIKTGTMSIDKDLFYPTLLNHTFVDCCVCLALTHRDACLNE